jgi:polysaccharide export outer membrane protein
MRREAVSICVGAEIRNQSEGRLSDGQDAIQELNVFQTAAAVCRSLVLAGMAMLAVACASDGAGPRDAQLGVATNIGVAEPMAPPADYRIGPLDKININVFRVQTLSMEGVQVDAGGYVTLPLIGQVRASGRTTNELAADIAARLGKEYLESPQVTVWLEEAVSQKITVDGAVIQPGVYVLTGDTSLLQAVALARGPDSRMANLRRVAVFRTVQGQRTVAVFDLKAIREGKTIDPPVVGGDVVVVDGSQVKAAWREVIGAVPILAIFRPF